MLFFEVKYEPGELKAIASDTGKDVAIKVLKTTGEPTGIRLVADRNNIHADRNDLSFIKIEVVDTEGQLVPRDSIKIDLTLQGDGEFCCFGKCKSK